MLREREPPPFLELTHAQVAYEIDRALCVSDTFLLQHLTRAIRGSQVAHSHHCIPLPQLTAYIRLHPPLHLSLSLSSLSRCLSISSLSPLSFSLPSLSLSLSLSLSPSLSPLSLSLSLPFWTCASRESCLATARSVSLQLLVYEALSC